MTPSQTQARGDLTRTPRAVTAARGRWFLSQYGFVCTCAAQTQPVPPLLPFQSPGQGGHTLASGARPTPGR